MKPTRKPVGEAQLPVDPGQRVGVVKSGTVRQELLRQRSRETRLEVVGEAPRRTAIQDEAEVAMPALETVREMLAMDMKRVNAEFQAPVNVAR